jgi:Flp pilus assembly protein TadG
VNRVKQSIAGFLRDERGVLLAETLLLLPILIWGFLALFVYWDVFRTINVTQKAAYSISDMMSRQVVVNMQLIEGLQEVLDFLTPAITPSRMRITSIEMSEGTNVQAAWDGDDAYVLLFSRSPGDAVAEHTTTTIQALRPLIPILVDRESVIIVETWTDFTPRFNTGVLNFVTAVDNETFTNFVVTRPRGRRVCLEGLPACN